MFWYILGIIVSDINEITKCSQNKSNKNEVLTRNISIPVRNLVHSDLVMGISRFHQQM